MEIPNWASEQLMAEAFIEAQRRYQSMQLPSSIINTYAYNPAGFIHDCLNFPEGEAPTEYQDEVLQQIPVEKKVALRGPHGLGKTALMAWTILWGVLTSPDVKVPSTASSWRQLTKFLWPEIHKWARRLRWDRLGREAFDTNELLALSIKLGPTREAFAVAAKNPELIEGAHAARVVYCYDEAKAIPTSIWDASEGAFATGEAFAVACSTPGGASGRFYDICSKKPGYEDWWARHVTLEEAIKAGRISPEWVAQRLKQWGETSPVYQARVLGEFPDQAPGSLISLSWIETARAQNLSPDPNDKKIGVDVARYGDDDSCLVRAQGPVVMDIDIIHGQNTMEIAGQTKASGYPANVDEIGVGSGVVDRLEEQDYDVVGINVSHKAIQDGDFANLRAEAYWVLRDLFKNEQIDLSRIPNEVYDRLSGELTAIKYTYTSKGQIKIIPKETMKKDLGYSPDVADGLMLCYVPRRDDSLLLSDTEWSSDD